MIIICASIRGACVAIGCNVLVSMKSVTLYGTMLCPESLFVEFAWRHVECPMPQIEVLEK